VDDNPEVLLRTSDVVNGMFGVFS